MAPLSIICNASGSLCGGDRIQITENRTEDFATPASQLGSLDNTIPPIPAGLVDGAFETVVLVDGRQGTPATCSNDEVRHQDLLFSNLLDALPAAGAGAGCGSKDWDEIAVFSVNDAAVIDTGDAAGEIWTDATGETRTEKLDRGLVAVPLVLWLMKETDDFGESVEQRARRHVQEASMLYNLNRAGLRFAPSIKRVWTLSDADWIRTQVGTSCHPGTPDPKYFVPGTINVYYVEQLTSPENSLRHFSGWSCGDQGTLAQRSNYGNQVYISIPDAIHNTLATPRTRVLPLPFRRRDLFLFRLSQLPRIHRRKLHVVIQRDRPHRHVGAGIPRNFRFAFNGKPQRAPRRPPSTGRERRRRGFQPAAQPSGYRGEDERRAAHLMGALSFVALGMGLAPPLVVPTSIRAPRSARSGVARVPRLPARRGRFPPRGR